MVPPLRRSEQPFATRARGKRLAGVFLSLSTRFEINVLQQFRKFWLAASIDSRRVEKTIQGLKSLAKHDSAKGTGGTLAAEVNLVEAFLSSIERPMLSSQSVSNVTHKNASDGSAATASGPQSTFVGEELIEQLNRGYVCPQNAGPMWRAACDAGVDMGLIEDALQMSPLMRLREHQRALNQILTLMESRSHEPDSGSCAVVVDRRFPR